MHDDGREKAYIDTTSAATGPIERRRAWVFRTPVDGKPEQRSQRVLFIIDCRARQFAIRSVFGYPNFDGTGTPTLIVQRAERELEFVDIPPGTIASSLAYVACV